MGRIMNGGSGVFAGAAAFALSLGPIANAQQPQPRLSPPTEAQIAASPAAKRLKELLEAVNSGDAAVIHAFVQANGVQGPPPPPWSAALPLEGGLLDLHRRSRGFDLVRVERITGDTAIATVRNRLTGDEQPLAMKIEPQAPHRITSFTTNVAVPPSVASARPASAPLPEKAKLQQIGAYLKLLSDADIFSGVVMVAREGKPVFSQAYGYADREKKIRNRIDTPFDVASIGKVFTALAVGRLIEQGKLSYEDPLSKFIPDYPDPENAGKIKIKHLLSHTSGLGGLFNQSFFERLGSMRTVRAILDNAPKEAPRFEPGTQWAYSNLGYHLLGRVIEIASGQDYFDYVAQNVFAPAGMTRASFPHFDRGPVAMAQRYDMELHGSQLHYANQARRFAPRGAPDGGGIASAPDLLRLDNALRAGRVVKPETYRLHATPKPELGSPQYGYGFNMRARSGEPLLGHAGNGPGVCTDFGAVTGTPYTIVVLSNSTVSTCISVTSKILKVLAPAPAPAA